jgi:hypothetical protein
VRPACQEGRRKRIDPCEGGQGDSFSLGSGGAARRPGGLRLGLGFARHRLRDQVVERAVAGQPDHRLDGVRELVAGLDGDARLTRLELERRSAAVDRERVQAPG